MQILSMHERVRKGFILLDKWRGPTSHDVSSKIKKLIGAKKVGHIGTLDPQVSGMLPLLVGEATKIAPLLQKSDKEYVGVMHLHKDIRDKELKDAIKQNIGTVTQKPPVKSAVKREERQRKVYSFKMLEQSGKDVLFQTRCESGTYVRVICHSIGKMIGGAHMKELRRISVSSFTEKELVKFQNISDAIYESNKGDDTNLEKVIHSVEYALKDVKKIHINDSFLNAVKNGTPLRQEGIKKKDIAEEGEHVAVMHADKIVAVGIVQKNCIKIDRVID